MSTYGTCYSSITTTLCNSNTIIFSHSFLFFPNISTFAYREYYTCFDDYYGANHTSDRLTQLITKYEIEELKNQISFLNGLYFFYSTKIVCGELKVFFVCRFETFAEGCLSKKMERA